MFGSLWPFGFAGHPSAIYYVFQVSVGVSLEVNAILCKMSCLEVYSLGFIGKTWQLITNRNNLAAQRAPEPWAFSFWFRLCPHWIGEQEYLNRNLECLHCVRRLAWPTAFLSRPLQSTTESSPLSFFYYSEEPLCCRRDFSNVTHFG